jgi:hypothetical protein
VRITNQSVPGVEQRGEDRRLMKASYDGIPQPRPILGG